MSCYRTVLQVASICLFSLLYFTASLQAQSPRVTIIRDGDVLGLIRAIEMANESPEPDSIVLAPNGTYTLRQKYNCVTNGFYDYRSEPPFPCDTIIANGGPVGLPQITRIDWGGKFILNARGATIRRADNTEPFRIWYVWTNGEADFYNMVVENGYAFRTLNTAREVISGGGMYLNLETKVKLENCIFKHNRSEGQGGAIRISARSNTEMIHCEFRDNYALEDGGGVHNVVSPIKIVRCRFLNNFSALRGGGLYSDGNDWTVRDSRTIIKDCIFDGNEVDRPDTDRGVGAGLYLFLYADQKAIIDGCLISHNAVNGNRGLGGGLFLASGDLIFDRDTIVSVGNTSEYQLTNSLIYENTSSELGGGMALGTGQFSIINTTLHQNQSLDLGGGALYNDPRVVFINCTISENTAQRRGGGVIYIVQDEENTRQAEFYNCVWLNNRASNIGERTLGEETIQNNCSLSVNDNVRASTNIEFPGPSGQRGDAPCAQNGQFIDPELGPLQDNGGAVFTQLPEVGSPAYQTGNIDFLPEEFRPASGIVNIGAFPFRLANLPNFSFQNVVLSTPALALEGPQIAIYPNPLLGDELNLEVNTSLLSNSSVKLSLYDSWGRVLKEELTAFKGEQTTLKLPNEDLQPGLYYLLIHTAQGTITKPLMIGQH